MPFAGNKAPNHGHCPKVNHGSSTEAYFIVELNRIEAIMMASD